MVHEPKKNFYKKFLHEPFPVESSLHNQLHDHLNAEIATGTLINIGDCVEYITWTYFFRRLVMNPSYYQLTDSSAEAIESHLTNMVKKVVKDLVAAKCITLANEFDVTSTTLGEICSNYYLHYRSVGLFTDSLSNWRQSLGVEDGNNNDLRRGSGGSGSGSGGESVSSALLFAKILQASPVDLQSVMRLLTDAFEFSELPVRHNEELLNAQLADALPWNTGDLPMESPHTKALLLLMSHFTRGPLPITDYVNDTKTVLDQVPRVLNAMIDISADMGLLDVALSLMMLSKAVIQVIYVYLLPKF
jgi:activating signal cointegrator complex subunit 3